MSRRAAAQQFVPMAQPVIWPELVNVASCTPVHVALVDGTFVDSTSELWRAECEARHVLRLRSKMQRHEYLARVEAKRGKDSRDVLQAAVMALWQRLRFDQDKQDN